MTPNSIFFGAVVADMYQIFVMADTMRCDTSNIDSKVQDFAVDDIPFEELPEILLIGANGYIAPIFWKTEALSYGMIGSIPMDGRGRRIPAADLESTYAVGLPVERDLLIAFLTRQMEEDDGTTV